MDVKAIKLVSGEELIGEVIHEDESSISLRNPLAIMLQRTNTGDLNIGFIPFAPYVGKDVTFDFASSNLIFSKEVDEQMKSQYTTIFGGIVTPPKTLILG